MSAKHQAQVIPGIDMPSPIKLQTRPLILYNGAFIFPRACTWIWIDTEQDEEIQDCRNAG
jgi:hypothetical protein